MGASYIQGLGNKPLIGQTIGAMFDAVAAEFGDNEALVSVFENRRFTYRSLQEEVDRCARALLGLGVQHGDHVGIWSTNCSAWVLAQLATAKLGAVLVSINPSYRLH
jgi:fatty-acyl-CoA synthase